MSKYTTELRYVCESLYPYSESKGYNDVNDILDETWDKVFDFDFPIFDENYRAPLCKKILKHYYTREICEETYGLWKLRLDSEMNEIMPYFNKLYNSELITIEPLVNYRVQTIGNKSKTGSDTVAGMDSNSDTTNVNTSSGKYGGYTDTHTGTDTNVKSGSEEIEKSGSEAVAKTGNEVLAKGGTEARTLTNIETNKKTGSETHTRTGSENVINSNSKDKTIEGGYEDSNTIVGDKTNEHQVTQGDLSREDVNLFTDTPQGNIANMGTGYSGASGVPIVGTDTAYLTTAEKNTTTETDTRVIQDKTSYSQDYEDKNTRTYKGKDANNPYTESLSESGGSTKTYLGVTDTTNYNNRTDTIQYAKADNLEFVQRADTKTYNNVKDEKTFTDRADTTTYNDVTNTETKNLQDARTYNQQDNSQTTTTKNGSANTNKTMTYNNVNAYIDNVVGSRAKSDSELLMEFRKTFLNIDDMIIKQLSDLFILLW